jgi:putative transcriptional regulator
MPIKEKTALTRARIKSGLMQVEVAKQAGISLSMLSRYENGWAVPSKPTASKIARVLGTTVEELFAEARIETPGNPEPRHTNDATLNVVDEYLKDTLGTPEEASPRVRHGSHIKTIHVDTALEVMSMDRPGPGGLCHKYEFFASQEDGMGMPVGAIHFQEGRVSEVGVNGVQHEAILSVMIDRLRTLYSSRKATEKEKCALMYLLKAREVLTAEMDDEAE